MSALQRADTPRQSLWLPLTRAAWVAVFTLTLGVYAALLPGRFDALHSLQAVGGEAVARAGLSPDFYAWYHLAFEVAFAALSAVIGLVIFWRRPNDRAAMFIALAMVMYGARVGGFPVDAPRTVYPGWRWLVDGVQSAGMALSLVAFYVFPDGRFVPRWTKVLAAVWLVWAASWALFPESRFNLLRWNESLDTVGYVYLAQSVWYATGAFAQVRRYTTVATPTERQQTKWVVFGLVLVVLAYIVLNLPYLVIPALRQPGTARLIFGLVHKPLLVLALAAMPSCFAVAALRYHLWDIDLVINRAAVYALLSALLTAIYFASILILQQVFRPALFQTSPLAVAASTLVIAWLFKPLQRWVQAFIDRRFYRTRADPARVVTAFSAAVRDEVRLERICELLEQAIAEATAPAHVLCWLRTPRGFGIYFQADSPTPTGGPGAEWTLAEVVPDDSLVLALQETEDAVDLSSLRVDSHALARLRAGNVQLVVPLIAQGALLGWVTLGERRSQQGYSWSDRQLFRALANQAAPTIRVAELVREQRASAVEREQLEQELRIARLIQQSLLPREPLELPGWKLGGYYHPAQAVGGDFYDYFVLDSGQIALVIGDVTDKGIPAALLMAAARSLLRSAAYQLVSPARVLRRVNKLLYRDTPANMFVTCLYVVLDPESGHLRYANAGHSQPFRRADGAAVELQARGMPLGMMPGVEYEEYETTVGPDECLLFYSDGLVEAHNPWREMFGSERLRELVGKHQGDGQALIEHLVGELSRFTGGGWQEDDVTLVTMQRVLDGSLAAD